MAKTRAPRPADTTTDAAPRPRTPRLPKTVAAAVNAMRDKKALDIVVLDLRKTSGFTDFFVICSGTNSRQIQTIADEVGMQLKKLGEMPTSVEGHKNAEWILMDYGDYVVHVFSDHARGYYDIERLWRDATEVPLT